jgi:penicillin-insensitive murein endopeptidase
MNRPVALLLTALLMTSADAASIGTVERGSLTEGVELPVEGDHHYILPRRHRARRLCWATRPLVDLLLEGAREVARKFPGARLGVGNLSRRHGGKSPYSRSHQSGRDADLAFYMVDRKGRPRAPEDYLRLNRRGVARNGWQLDAARVWHLVETFLRSDKAQVQWILLHQSLKAILLRHARAIGADPEMTRRAEQVLHQPGWALPHDDHLHIRIFCPLEDLAQGCRDTGPRWSWIARPPDTGVTQPGSSVAQ